MLGTYENTPVAAVRQRNPATPLDLDWVMGARVNRSAVERRVESMPKQRSVKTEWQEPWLLGAVTCIDLTTLSGDDTPGSIKRLCAKAKQPIRPDMLTRLGLDRQSITVGAVCVYPNRVKDGVDATSAGGVLAGAFAYALPANMPVDVPARFLLVPAPGCHPAGFKDAVGPEERRARRGSQPDHSHAGRT